MPSSEKEPEGWNAADKFTVVMETAALNANEFSVYCRERGQFSVQVSRWRQPAPTSAKGRACLRHLMPTPSLC